MDTNKAYQPYMPTRRQLKEFSQLDDARRRRESGIFVAEGSKCVLELLEAFRCRFLFARQEWLDEHIVDISRADIDTISPANGELMRELTRLPSAPPVIAFFEQRQHPFTLDNNELTVALDRVQDPGNLGTIIRCCDWFGVRRIVASSDTVDCYNPKAVQATMGALARVEIAYGNLAELLGSATIPVYGTFLDGDNIYRTPLTTNGVLILGNEGSGIGSAIEATVTHRLFIPPYPADRSHVESLNVGMAAAIALSHFRANNG